MICQDPIGHSSGLGMADAWVGAVLQLFAILSMRMKASSQVVTAVLRAVCSSWVKRVVTFSSIYSYLNISASHVL